MYGYGACALTSIAHGKREHTIRQLASSGENADAWGSGASFT